MLAKKQSQVEILSTAANIADGLHDVFWHNAWEAFGGIEALMRGQDPAESVSVPFVREIFFSEQTRGGGPSIESRVYSVTMSVFAVMEEEQSVMLRALAHTDDPEYPDRTAYLMWNGTPEQFNSLVGSKVAVPQDGGVKVKGTWVQVGREFVQQVVSERKVAIEGTEWSDEVLDGVVRVINLWTIDELPRAVITAMADRGLVTSHHVYRDDEMAPAGVRAHDVDNPEEYGWACDRALGHLSQLHQLDVAGIYQRVEEGPKSSLVLGRELANSVRYRMLEEQHGLERELKDLLLSARLVWEMIPNGYRKTWVFPDRTELIGNFGPHEVEYHTMVGECDPLRCQLRF